MESAAVHSSEVHEVDFRIPPSPFAKRSFFRKPTRPSLPLRKGVLKSSRPSLPLKKAPPFSPSLSSIVFATLSVPLLGDRNPQGREDVTALRCSEPLRSKDGGPSKVFAMFCGLGPHGDGLALCECLSAGALRNLLIIADFRLFSWWFQ